MAYIVLQEYGYIMINFLRVFWTVEVWMPCHLSGGVLFANNSVIFTPQQ